METYKILKYEICKRGYSQIYVVNSMNFLDPSLNMTASKLSSILLGKRKLSGNEFIALCKVLNLDIDSFTPYDEN
ncbi:helix-turn-helix transcriptional regulator [Lachnospiraceae bacterium NSJ-143]|nr:helix-turn-helix transcriptional regulator [Lachnospiraceae bacterium NSJ-143]